MLRGGEVVLVYACYTDRGEETGENVEVPGLLHLWAVMIDGSIR